jgi:hypothetical protein
MKGDYETDFSSVSRFKANDFVVDDGGGVEDDGSPI